MEALQISTKSTDNQLIEFDTVASQQFDTKPKNEKIINLINTKKQLKRDSSESSKRLEQLLDYLNHTLDYQAWQESLTYIWQPYKEFEQFRLSIKEIVETYMSENIMLNLDINKWLVKEYAPYDSINLLHSLVDIGREIFKDARSTNELEDKSINAFFQKKAKTIHFKELK
jgi:hypothetical protein